MSEHTVTRAHLSELVYQEVGLSRNESADLLEMVLAERIGRNPKTGQEVPISPRRVLVFRPSQLLKAQINTGCSRKV
jgi:integration host factor subunit alpha